MKVTPIAQGTGVPAASESLGKTVSPDTRARAISIASGQEPIEQQSSGDAQVDKINTRRIKMKTQVSTNRDIPVEEPVLEAPAEEKAIPDTNEQAQGTEETRPLSPQFAALARTKRALQVKERELEQRESALSTRDPVNSDDYISKAELKANPMRVFDVVPYDALTESLLNQQSAPLDSKTIDALVEKKLNERLDKEFSSRDMNQEQQILNEIKREVSAIIASEDFEAIQGAKANNHPEFTNGKDPVTELIHRTYKKTGQVMDTLEAAQLVENQLIDELLPYASLKKVQSRMTPAQEEQKVEQIPTPRPNTKIMRTLTNRDNASPTMDRRARAIAAMLGTLKKG